MTVLDDMMGAANHWEAECARIEAALSTSEKRAETLERERDEALMLAEGPSTLIDLARGAVERGFRIVALESELSTALVLVNNYQSLMVTAERERDEAKAIIANLVAERTEMTTEFARTTDERDEARLSLAKVVEELAAMDKWLAKAADELNVQNGMRAMDLGYEITEFRRSALHRSQG